MPQYMLLIYGPAEGGPSPDELAAQMPRWFEYTQGLREAGLFVAGDPLHGTDAATTVRVRDGETQITDGPFAETKEMLGGYYLIDVPDLDAALELRRAGAERRLRLDRGAPDHGHERAALAGRQAQARHERAGERRPAGRPGRHRRARLPRGAGRRSSPRSSATSATSSSPRTPCRTPSRRRWRPGRATASRPNPGAWITVAARRRAIDRLRRDRALGRPHASGSPS